MKIGPLTIERRATNAVAPVSASPPELGERGATGTQIFGGIVQQQDYNADLQAPQCYDIYDKMRLSDGQVKAGLSVVKLPILRANWEIEAASDSAEDKMIAEIAESDLESMSLSFISFLRQALLELDYGCMPFEKCWYIGDDGLVHLRKFAPRLPRTIMRWNTDEHGGFAGVQQGAILASGYKPIDIPAEKLILFVNEQEGSNFRGVSMLRAAYKHWFYKDGHYRIDAIANEKRGVGVDIGTIKPGATNKAAIKDQLERSLMTLHAHDKQYIVEDEENYQYRLETGGARGGQNAIMATIEHHDLRILRSILAEFLNMGSASTGSLAMHKDKSAFFLMALEALADGIAQTLTTHYLKQWVDYNWRVTAYPRFKYSRLDTRDFAGIATAVNQLMSVGALTASPATEAELRVLGDLPELEIDPPIVIDGEDEIDSGADAYASVAAIQAKQIARVRELIASGKPVESIRLPYKAELIAAVAAEANA